MRWLFSTWRVNFCVSIGFPVLVRFLGVVSRLVSVGGGLSRRCVQVVTLVMAVIRFLAGLQVLRRYGDVLRLP